MSCQTLLPKLYFRGARKSLSDLLTCSLDGFVLSDDFGCVRKKVNHTSILDFFLWIFSHIISSLTIIQIPLLGTSEDDLTFLIILEHSFISYYLV